MGDSCDHPATKREKALFFRPRQRIHDPVDTPGYEDFANSDRVADRYGECPVYELARRIAILRRLINNGYLHPLFVDFTFAQS